MTYRELLYKATILCDKGEITIGQYEEMTKPLDREVEQEPFKPMVEIDLYSVIKQKYIERDVLDKIIAEIEEAQTYDGIYIDRAYVLEIIDECKVESEG